MNGPVRRSLRTKVVVIVLTTTLVALLVSTATLLTYEVETYRGFLIGDANTQADILARVTAPALAFDDPDTARVNLDQLSSRAGIRAAAIYTPSGELFATYARAPAATFPPLGEPGVRIEGSTLTLFVPIVQNDEVLGTLYLQSSYDLAARLRDYLVILGSVLLVSLLVALVVSVALANNVTGPVRAITDVARQVIEHRDFSLRARRTTQDEIGVLVDAFNTMLAEVGQRAVALEASNSALQQETEERRLAEGALRVADQRKDEFLATLAHELRNPLAPMVNAVGLMRAPNADASIGARALDIIERQLRQLVRLVDDLLDVSRITSGKLAVRKEPLVLADVVKSAIDTARPLLDARRHVLTVTLPPEPVYLQADFVRLSQVFSNLLNNAAKYSEPERHIALTAEVSRASVRVRIDDQGIGIAAETLPKIFEMFTQGDSESELSSSGLGVGLALAKRLIELHGGSIVAESDGLGSGSSFVVTLPVMVALTAQRAAPRAPESAERKYRILLVDDNVDFVASLSLLLQGAGHEVAIAHDADQALEAARKLVPEVCFLDLGLPRVSGYELAGLLRAEPAAANATLVALSGWGQQRDRQRSRDAGFALHLVKPVELHNIDAVLASLVNAKRM
jgi:signal transduction histidine kinase/ActR/RegA family two-component response regulator